MIVEWTLTVDGEPRELECSKLVIDDPTMKNLAAAAKVIAHLTFEALCPEYGSQSLPLARTGGSGVRR